MKASLSSTTTLIASDPAMPTFAEPKPEVADALKLLAVVGACTSTVMEPAVMLSRARL